MAIDTFARGFIIVLSVAAPVGAIGVLCIRRTLKCRILLDRPAIRSYT